MQQSLRYEVYNASTTPTSSPFPLQGEYKKKKKYQQPDQPLAAMLWRFSLWISVTFGLSVMEPWEKLLVGLASGSGFCIYTLLLRVCFGFLRLTNFTKYQCYAVTPAPNSCLVHPTCFCAINAIISITTLYDNKCTLYPRAAAALYTRNTRTFGLPFFLVSSVFGIPLIMIIDLWNSGFRIN